MANILKPIGFVLILGAVAAGAYYLGQSSGPPAGQAAGKTGAKTGEKPGMVQQVKQWVSGGESSGATTASAAPAGGNDPASGAEQPASSGTQKPAQPKPAANAGAITVPAQVVALSGDTVQTGAKAKVRLLGVKTPDTGFDAAHAREALVGLLGDGAVKLQFLSDDRSAALVWKDGRLINESMVRLGWSRSGLPRFTTAEAAAKSQRVGLWSPEGWMGAP